MFYSKYLKWILTTSVPILIMVIGCVGVNVDSKMKVYEFKVDDSKWKKNLSLLPEDAVPELIFIPSGEFLQGTPKEFIDKHKYGSKYGHSPIMPSLDLDNKYRSSPMSFYNDYPIIEGIDGAYDAESPQLRMTIDGFWLGKYEVTNNQYMYFIKDTGYQSPRCPESMSKKYNWNDGNHPKGLENFPVVCINYEDILAYIHWLSQRTGEEFRLPTESEWEYAASYDGDDQEDTKRGYSWGNSWDSKNLNFNGNSTALASSSPMVFNIAGRAIKQSPLTGNDDIIFNSVGTYESGKSYLGLYDMSGNAAEMVSNAYMPYQYHLYDSNLKNKLETKTAMNFPPSCYDYKLKIGGTINLFLSEEDKKGFNQKESYQCSPVVVKGRWRIIDDYTTRTAARSAVNRYLKADYIGFRVAKLAKRR